MPRLLLADDNPTNRRVVELTFAMEEMDVVAFSDGESALEYLRRGSADVALVDLSLPGMDGYSVCRNLKSDARTAHISVLLLVGRFDEFDQELAEQVGYSGHLTKPFQTNDLVEMVDRALEESRSAKQCQEPTIDSSEHSGVADVDSPSGQESRERLFEIPFSEAVRPVVFALKSYQCRPHPSALSRVIVDATQRLPTPTVDPEAADDEVPPRDEADSVAPEPPTFKDEVIDEPLEDESLEVEAAEPFGEEVRPASSDREEAHGTELSEEQMRAVLGRLNEKLPDVVRAILQEEDDTTTEKSSPPTP